jgi:hypothetical protein
MLTQHADSFRSKQLAEIFMQITKTMTSRHPIVIIATSQQQQSIHPSLVTNHIFNQLFHLNPPGRDERKQVRVTSPNNPFNEKKHPSMELMFSNLDFACYYVKGT